MLLKLEITVAMTSGNVDFLLCAFLLKVYIQFPSADSFRQEARGMSQQTEVLGMKHPRNLTAAEPASGGCEGGDARRWIPALGCSGSFLQPRSVAQSLVSTW